MQDDASGIDYFLKGTAEPAPQLTIYRFGNTLNRELAAVFIESPGVDLVAETFQHNADRVAGWRAALAMQCCTETSRAQDLVH